MALNVFDYPNDDTLVQNAALSVLLLDEYHRDNTEVTMILSPGLQGHNLENGSPEQGDLLIRYI